MTASRMVSSHLRHRLGAGSSRTMGRRQDGQEELSAARCRRTDVEPVASLRHTAHLLPLAELRQADGALREDPVLSLLLLAPRHGAPRRRRRGHRVRVRQLRQRLERLLLEPLAGGRHAAPGRPVVVVVVAPWLCPPPAPPKAARAWAGLPDGEEGWALALALRRERAHRATAARPTTQMSAQSRAARMTTTSELTPAGGSAGGIPGMRPGSPPGGDASRNTAMAGASPTFVQRRWLEGAFSAELKLWRDAREAKGEVVVLAGCDC
ncbi:hypothetical protein ZWY2020_042677 [Hordeum vulgare]|nr:hypothetical protein ZWY2020_042677 [Hordeum vulgare]